MRRLSRRQILGGTAVAAALLPLGLHAEWAMRDFTRHGYTPLLPPAPPGRINWQNWSGLQRAQPRELYVARDEADLAMKLATADTPVRAVGSGHSFSGLVPSSGTILDISPIAGVLAEDRAAGTVTFGAGTRLQQAARLLADRGLALANLSDIDTQTLAGMFATSTHGTGRALRAIHDHITGFRLILPDGQPRDVTAQNDPALFQAGKVSLGSLGVLSQITIKPVPAFNLNRRMWVEKAETLLARIEALSRQHRNFEFYYLPSTGRVAAITHDIHVGPVSGRQPSVDEAELDGLRTLRNNFGWFPWLRQRLAAIAIAEEELEHSSDESWKLLATGRPTRFNEMEYELPVANGVKALREVMALADAEKSLFFPIEVRFTAADDAWLSMFNGGERLSISIHSAAQEDVDFLFSRFEPLFVKHGGRPHWGKLHSLKASQLRALYPRFDDFCALRRTLDPKGRMLNPYLAELFDV